MPTKKTISRRRSHIKSYAIQFSDTNKFQDNFIIQHRKIQENVVCQQINKHVDPVGIKSHATITI